MMAQETKVYQSAFNTGILTTFGKLDQHDIGKFDGDPEQLVSELIEQYGWNVDEAQSRVEGFCASLSSESHFSKLTPNQRVRS